MESDDHISLLAALEFVCGENKNLCRICLSRTEEVISFNKFVQIETYYCHDFLSYNTVLAKLSIPDEPLLPRVLCDDCSSLLINTYMLQQLAEFTNKKWINILKILDDTLSKSCTLNLHKVQSAIAMYHETDIISSQKKCTADSKAKTVVNINKTIKTVKHKVSVIKNDFMCQECGKIFRANYLLTRHVMQYHSESNYPCPDCSKVFNVKKYLERHAEKVHYPKNLKCSKCPKKFSTTRNLNIHLKFEHIPAKCHDCNIDFPSKKSLKYHLSHHKVNTCPYCNKKYSNVDYYKCHVKYCGKGGNLDTFICDICRKIYVAKGGLQRHMRTDHGFGKVLSCKWCGKKYDVISRLKDHIVTHTKEKQFHCDKCGKHFVTLKSLTHHIRLHTGERPYPCHMCDQSFQSTSRRLEHQRRKHFAPAHHCSLCTAKFVTPFELRKHLKRHFKPSSKLYITESDHIK